MLLGLIFRGVAFEFRFKHHPRIWDVAFALLDDCHLRARVVLAPSCKASRWRIFNTPVARIG